MIKALGRKTIKDSDYNTGEQHPTLAVGRMKLMMMNEQNKGNADADREWKGRYNK